MLPKFLASKFLSENGKWRTTKLVMKIRRSCPGVDVDVVTSASLLLELRRRNNVEIYHV